MTSVIIHNLGIIAAILVGWIATIAIAVTLKEHILVRPRFIRGLLVAVGFSLTAMMVGMTVIQSGNDEIAEVSEQNVQTIAQLEYDRCTTVNTFRYNDREEKEAEIASREDRLVSLRSEPPLDVESYPGWNDLPPALQDFINGLVASGEADEAEEIARLESEVAALEDALRRAEEEFPIEQCGRDPSLERLR